MDPKTVKINTMIPKMITPSITKPQPFRISCSTMQGFNTIQFRFPANLYEMIAL